MKLLGKDQILAADDLPHEDVKVPEWGGVVRVRSMTGADRDAWESEQFTDDGTARNKGNIRARLVVFTVVDGKGAPLFTAADIDDLGGRSAKALDRVFKVAQRINGMRRADIEDSEKK